MPAHALSRFSRLLTHPRSLAALCCARAQLHYVEPGAPPIAAICEQVSHHPPVTAFASYDAALRCAYTGWVDIAPRFMGLAIRVPMTGQRQLALRLPDGTQERYCATIPAMEWHFIPAVRAEYSGTWRLWCDDTGLAAEARALRIYWHAMRVLAPADVALLCWHR
jgi:hypothetical protein